MDDQLNLTTAEKCLSIWRAVCEDRTVDFTWDELQALQDAGFITGLKRVHPYVGKRRGKEERWVFEWTDRLKRLAQALGQYTVRQPNDNSPVCKHGIAEGHCPECLPRDDTGTIRAEREAAEHQAVMKAINPKP